MLFLPFLRIVFLFSIWNGVDVIVMGLTGVKTRKTPLAGEQAGCGTVIANILFYMVIYLHPLLTLQYQS